MTIKPRKPYDPTKASKHRPATPEAARVGRVLNDDEKLALAMAEMRVRPARTLSAIARDLGLTPETLSEKVFALDEELFRDHRQALINPAPYNPNGYNYEPLTTFKVIKLNTDGSTNANPTV